MPPKETYVDWQMRRRSMIYQPISLIRDPKSNIDVSAHSDAMVTVSYPEFTLAKGEIKAEERSSGSFRLPGLLDVVVDSPNPFPTWGSKVTPAMRCYRPCSGPAVKPIIFSLIEPSDEATHDAGPNRWAKISRGHRKTYIVLLGTRRGARISVMTVHKYRRLQNSEPHDPDTFRGKP